MERTLFQTPGIEVISRDGRLFVRYDAGAHMVTWREDEILPAELEALKSSTDGGYGVLLALHKRLETAGVDPHTANWRPA